MKFYAVRKGKRPGIYTSWNEAKEQVSGFSGAVYKSFTTLNEAEEFIDKKENQKETNPGEYFATIFTDGGTRNTGNVRGGHVKKTDKAAWAYLIEEKGGNRYDGAGGVYGATNNQMELTAFINSLAALVELGFNKENLLFCLDSKYVLDNISRIPGWKKRGWRTTTGPVKNQEYWQRVENLLALFPNPHYKWVKGHDKSAGNIYVDHKLNKVMDEMPKKE
ncbi:ribonuclease H family protein [Lactobacillus sp. PV012]|uniref:ribonuclease H family protein n=1 Tax=Lactobacillus sp. PV012 TaxID=2594494 RepID=UPI0022408545|nr:ribonuclease H family protein [Lactobacillus sp. PV012]QNQ81703.1 ribonuclease [Lactobacillus sp. PV012]